MIINLICVRVDRQMFRYHNENANSHISRLSVNDKVGILSRNSIILSKQRWFHNFQNDIGGKFNFILG